MVLPGLPKWANTPHHTYWSRRSVRTATRVEKAGYNIRLGVGEECCNGGGKLGECTRGIREMTTSVPLSFHLLFQPPSHSSFPILCTATPSSETFGTPRPRNGTACVYKAMNMVHGSVCVHD